jgi:hypothetical protein
MKVAALSEALLGGQLFVVPVSDRAPELKAEALCKPPQPTTSKWG